MKQKSLFFASRSAPIRGKKTPLRDYGAQLCQIIVRQYGMVLTKRGVRENH